MESTLTLAIIGHLVGDYLLQNDWMALNKKKDSAACCLHCFIWALSVCLFSGWAATDDAGWPHFMVIFWTLFSTHFIQDRTSIILWWMTKVNRQHQFATGPCAPWSIIVVDNVWHIVTLWAVWRFLA